MSETISYYFTMKLSQVFWTMMGRSARLGLRFCRGAFHGMPPYRIREVNQNIATYSSLPLPSGRYCPYERPETKKAPCPRQGAY